jgi:hypothetical protein
VTSFQEYRHGNNRLLLTNSRSKRTLWTLFATSTVLFFSSGALASDPGFSVDANVRYDDNLGFASSSDDKVDDLTFGIGAGMDWLFVQDATTEAGINLGLYHREVMDTDDLSHYGLDAGVQYRGQSGADLDAFWWKLAGNIKTLKFRDSDVRDGYIWEAGASVGKRFNQRFGLSGGYRYERRASTDDSPSGQMGTWNPDKVFDLKKDVVFVQADVSLGAVSTLSGSFTYKDGTEATSGRFGVLGGWIDWAWDPAFGPGWQVWKIDAEQYIYDLTLNHSFSEKVSLEAKVIYIDAKGDAGVFGKADYNNLALSAGLAFQF